MLNYIKRTFNDDDDDDDDDNDYTHCRKKPITSLLLTPPSEHSTDCECGASEQTADHVLTACPIHRAPHGARGLTVLDDETRCWLNDITASI